jgi:hypothetical protein
MRIAFPFILVFAFPLAIVQAEGIEEIRIADVEETLTLRANGTADLAYRGRWNWGLIEERVGCFHARFDTREFRRLADLVRKAHFDTMKGFYLPYSMSIVRTTVVIDGKAKTVERHDRGVLTDPEPPSQLWTLEMAVRGLASQIQWEPIPSGVRVVLGEKSGMRGVMVRELGTDYGVASVRTEKSVVEIPLAPGNYMVEMSDVHDGRWEDSWQWWASIPPDKYVAVAAHLPAANSGRETPPRRELIITTANRWWLYCSSDGPGTLGHGPEISDTAEFKAGTIDVAAVDRELAKVTTKEPLMGYRFRITSRENGGQPGLAETRDSKIVLAVFAKAARKESSLRRGPGFDRLWAEHPPALRDN